MEAKELQICDWVFVYDDDTHTTGKPYQVTGLSYNDADIYFNDPESRFVEAAVDESDCKPIPLTEDILKFNGFDLEKYADVRLAYHASELLVSTEFTGVDTYNDMPLFGCIYVHQLQHALRSVGMSELADNFKIE